MIIKIGENKRLRFSELKRYNKYIYILIILSVTCLFLPFKAYKNISIYFNSILRPNTSISDSRYIMALDRFSNPAEIIIRYIKAIIQKTPALYINMSYKNYQKLHYRVYLIRKTGRALNAEDKKVLVNAKVIYNQNEYAVKIRLKGSGADHRIGKRWSFRIKLKNNGTIMGMNRFSIHSPAARNYLNEWFYHKILNYLGLFSLQYKFVEVYINGEYIGIYAIEEYFNDNLIESNRRRDGLLLRDNAILFQENRVKKNPALWKSYLLFEKIYDKYVTKQIKTQDFYDLDKLAKHIAITEIFSGYHSHWGNNFITYFNPLTNKVEVIGYDLTGGELLYNIGLQIETRAKYPFSGHLNNIYRDKMFFKKYLHYILKYSDPDNFIDFFEKYELEITKALLILGKERPWLDPELRFFSKNQRYIRKYFSNYIPDLNSEITDEMVFEIMKAHSIVPISYLKDNNTESNKIFMYQNGNYNQFPFIKYNSNKKIARISKGNYIISNDLVIPKNHKFIIDAGVNLVLSNSASILSFSAIYFRGTNLNPINITSSLESKSSVVVVYTEDVSELKYVNFKELSPPNSMDLLITGAVNFYEANVLIENCSFQKNFNSDDNLNIIRSRFKIIDTILKNSESDAVDIDFGNGEILNTLILNSGNDGIDLAGSQVYVNNLTIINSKDKGISAGEKTKIILTNTLIKKSNIGIAIKDESNLSADNISIFNSNYGLALYKKKKQYSFPTAKIGKITFNNINTKDILVEKNSNLYINQKKINNYENSINNILN